MGNYHVNLDYVKYIHDGQRNASVDMNGNGGNNVTPPSLATDNVSFCQFLACFSTFLDYGF